MRAPGSTVLGLVEDGQTLLEIEVQTNWTPDDIKALALEEGYGINAVNGRFQRVAKAKPKPTGIVRRSLEQEAIASIELDRDQTHALDEPAPVEAPETDDAAEDAGGTSADEPAPSSTGTGAVEATSPPGADGEAALGSAAAPAPVPPAHVPCAEDLMSAALATGDPDLEQAVVAIEVALTTLAHDLIAYETRSDALAEVRRLEAELETARIRAGLGPATSSPAVPVQVTGATAQPGLTAGGVTRVSHAGQGGVAGVRLPDGVTYKDIRAWADKVGIRTTPRGRLADDVVLRYIEAHPQAGAA